MNHATNGNQFAKDLEKKQNYIGTMKCMASEESAHSALIGCFDRIRAEQKKAQDVLASAPHTPFVDAMDHYVRSIDVLFNAYSEAVKHEADRQNMVVTE